MDVMLNNIGNTLAARANILNATNVATDAFIGNADLDFPSGHLMNALGASDREQTIFAFNVLNSMCGNRLPVPNFVDQVPRANSEMVYSDGSPLSYQNKVDLAADISNSISHINADLVHAYTRTILAAQARGHSACVFIKLLPIIYA
jgi:hypothetical protein